MQHILLIGIGGALGAVSRYGIGMFIHRKLGHGFPHGTLAVNVIGCLIIGLLFHIIESTDESHRLWRSGMITGFLGALTTFSAFGFETVKCFQQGNPVAGAMNVALNVTAGVIAVCVGITVARVLW